MHCIVEATRPFALQYMSLRTSMLGGTFRVLPAQYWNAAAIKRIDKVPQVRTVVDVVRV
jgi:hypothetical protein